MGGALADEVAIEAAERGLDGRERETWVDRRLGELTDLSTPLPAEPSPAVAVAATYRQVVRTEIGVDLGDMVIDGAHVGEPVDPADAPGLSMGPDDEARKVMEMVDTWHRRSTTHECLGSPVRGSGCTRR